MTFNNPRIWMAYLYYETVHTKIWKHQKENHTANEPLIWPRSLAAWHLRHTFFYHLKWERMNDPDYLDPVLDGFAVYLDLLGIATILKPDEWKSEVHLLQRYVPGKFPDKKAIIEAQEAISKKDREGFVSYLHRVFNRSNNYILSEEEDEEKEVGELGGEIQEEHF